MSAKSITKLIKEDPDNKDKYIKIFADLLKEIHGTVVKEGVLPDAKARAIDWVEFLKGQIPEDSYNKLHNMLEAVPFDLHMIHGDYHANNVHYSNGEPILIDMDTLSTGNPVFEFANIFLAYGGYGELDHSTIEEFMGLDWDTCIYLFNKTIEFYFEDKDPQTVELNKHKAMVVGYTRALRRTIKRLADKTDLIEHYKKRLIEEINTVDDLTIVR